MDASNTTPIPSINMHGQMYPRLDGLVNINPPPYAPQSTTTTLSPTFQHNVSHSRVKKYKIFIIFLCIIILSLIIYILLKRDTHHIIHVASNILETRALINLTTTTAPPTTAPPSTVPPTTVPPTTSPPTTSPPTTALYYTKSFGNCNTQINSYDECVIGAQYLNLKNQTYQFVSIKKTNSTNDVMGCSYNNTQPTYILHFNIGGLASTLCTSHMSCICKSN